MSEVVASYRRILKSSSIIGGASVLNILIGLVRTKLLAVFLGPSGIGLAGLYTALITTVSAVATMGVGTTGTRQFAQAHSQGDQRALAVTRRAMFWCSLVLAITGALVVWLFRDFLAVLVLGSGTHATTVGWLALGVGLSVASSSQAALIQGMRRIGDMARLSVYGSVFNTLLGVGLIWQLGQEGLLAYVLVGPLGSFMLGHWYVSRLPKMVSGPIPIREMALHWKTLLRLGLPFMAAGLAASLGQLWIRVEVGNTLGTEALGHFQASWAISAQYITFVLSAISADYYPRLAGVINDHKAASRLVNEQTEIALLLSAPIFIAMAGLAPWVIDLLYSAAFAPAVSVLRWQILGDLLKVASWPLAYVILASGAGKEYFVAQSIVWLVIGASVAIFSDSFGLPMAGIAYLLGYIIYLPLVYWLARKNIGFKWSGPVAKLLTAILATCLAVEFMEFNYGWGSIVAVMLSVIYLIYAVIRLGRLGNLGGKVGEMIAKMKMRAF